LSQFAAAYKMESPVMQAKTPKPDLKSQAAKASTEPNSLQRRKIKTDPARMAVVTPSRQGAEQRNEDRDDLFDANLARMLGTTNRQFLDGLLVQLGNSGPVETITFKLSVIDGIRPRDQLETLLAAQMAAVHEAAMKFARQLAYSEELPIRESAERGLNKCARTFAAQMEALKRYRSVGEQKVAVQQVSVSDGGQAIVGNVTQAPPERAPAQAAESRPASPMPGKLRRRLLANQL
jgi:hypothetical protein